MNASPLHGLALLLSLSLAAGPLQAWDPPAEHELDLSLAAQLRQGEFIWLDLAGHRVGAVHTPASGRVKQRGALILLHDRDRNPDWPGLMRPLRTGLARAGWESLAVQMPITTVYSPAALSDRDRKEARARIDAAVAWFQQQGHLDIALIGHGLGAAFALDYLESIQDRPGQKTDTPSTEARITAMALIGMTLPEAWRQQLLAGLEGLDTPILDLYGSRDYAAVLAQADDRLVAGRRVDNSHYQQFRFPLAGHDFDTLQGPLTLRLRGWLDRVSKEIPARKQAEPEQKP